MSSNYDSTAWFYDPLAKLIYGGRIRKAQTAFLHLIPPDSRVLIAGGGTGWILEEIAKIRPAGLAIFYVEVSEKMIDISRKRKCGDNKVIFINKPIEDFATEDIDTVLTPFLFDNHRQRDAVKIFKSIQQQLSKNAIWINTDFQLTGKWWQSVLLRSMLLFFRLFGAVSNSETTDMQPVFNEMGYKKIVTKTFYGDFIRTDVWQKPA